MEEAAPTSSALLITATLPSALTLAPGETALPPPLRSQPTVPPVEGITSAQVNVRAEPSTASDILGVIPADTKVEIVGKDPGGNWFHILYTNGVDGRGWVTAKYVTTANGTEILIVGSDETNPKNSNVAIVQQQINVRSGPGTSFNSLGTLNAQDVVNLIGRDSNGAWLQIEYSSGPDGKGWVNAAFLQAQGLETLPIVMESGEVIGTATPTGIPLTSTPTIIPAWEDNDSQNNPIARILFEPLGTHALIYTGEVSTPDGDSEDWIQFTPYDNLVFASLECDGSNSLQTNLLEDGQPTALELACGDHMKNIDVKTGSVYLVQLRAPLPIDRLQYIHYTITIQTSP